MEVRLVRYPRGVINVRHTHPCVPWHVCAGRNLGNERRPPRPRLLLWFPEGAVMEHGASADGDVTVLFITNKPFAIHYQ